VYGNKQQNAEQAKFPVKVGDFIEFTHLEGADRAIITNMEKNIQENFGVKVVYEITKEGLKKVDKIVNPKPDTE
ncbi:chitin-binding protein, partial [Bacillus mycoides]